MTGLLKPVRCSTTALHFNKGLDDTASKLIVSFMYLWTRTENFVFGKLIDYELRIDIEFSSVRLNNDPEYLT